MAQQKTGSLFGTIANSKKKGAGKLQRRAESARHSAEEADTRASRKLESAAKWDNADQTYTASRFSLKHVVWGAAAAGLVAVGINNANQDNGSFDLSGVFAGASDKVTQLFGNETGNDNVASYNPDGRSFVQIKSGSKYSVLLSEAEDGGHMICTKEDGSFAMIYQGRAFSSADKAQPYRGDAILNGHDGAWVTSNLDCN